MRKADINTSRLLRAIQQASIRSELQNQLKNSLLQIKTLAEVDGITGATRTGNGVTGMVRFWLGPKGYGPLIRAIDRGEF